MFATSPTSTELSHFLDLSLGRVVVPWNSHWFCTWSLTCTRWCTYISVISLTNQICKLKNGSRIQKKADNLTSISVPFNASIQFSCNSVMFNCCPLLLRTVCQSPRTAGTTYWRQRLLEHWDNTNYCLIFPGINLCNPSHNVHGRFKWHNLLLFVLLNVFQRFVLQIVNIIYVIQCMCMWEILTVQPSITKI